LKSTPVKPVLFSKKGGDLPISDETLQKLMQDVLAKGAAFQFRAKGWSMTPFVKDGDVITIAPITKEKPAVGKVVAFIKPSFNHLVVHRVIGKQGEAFLIQGDNTAGQPDGLVLPGDILGCVTQVMRDGRQVFLGQGLERYLVAILSRNGWLSSILRRLRAWKVFINQSR
jgi:signal peptidase I